MRTSLIVPLFIALLAGCGGTQSEPPPAAPAANPPPSGSAANPASATSAPSAATATGTPERVEEGGLRIKDEVVGSGKEAKSGDAVVVHYTGKLEDGYVFDSSHKRGKPLELKLGVGMVIKGWDRGLVGMKEGGKRKLVIPPALAYGDQGSGGGKIPPNSTLTFDVEMVQVK